MIYPGNRFGGFRGHSNYAYVAKTYPEKDLLVSRSENMDANLTPAGSEYTLGKDLMIFETNFSPKNQVIPDTPCFSGRVAGPGDSSEEG